jgi:hypothetical protein
MGTGAVTEDSEVSTITNDQMATAYTLLWHTSPEFRSMMETIIEAGYDVTIKSVDGDSVKDLGGGSGCAHADGGIRRSDRRGLIVSPSAPLCYFQ